MVENTVLRGELVSNEEQNLTNPIQKVYVRDEVIKYLEKEEITKRINNILDPKKQMFVRFLWMTGVRVSEAINLKKEQINFTKNEIKILWQKRKAYTYRTLAIKQELSYVLRVYSISMKHDELLFPFSRQRAHQIIKETLGKEVNCHMLRHSFAVNFLRQSKNARDITILQKLLGHKHINTTMMYLQVVPNDLHESLSKVDM